jgi:phospholipase/carboxylesterase
MRQREILPCVETGPEGDAEGSIVWLHGLGADGHDFEDVVPLLELPRVRFVFPNAPRKPVTINGGLIMPAWYDITSLASARGENERHVRESADQVRDLIAREKERGVPASRLVLAGFSQGGSMALHVGPRYPETLLGILVLSGYEVLASTREDEASPANAATPMLFCHGTHDPLVPLAAGRRAYETYAAGRAAEWRAFPIAHQVSMEEIRVVRDWLHARFDSVA